MSRSEFQLEMELTRRMRMSMNVIGRVARCFLFGFGFIIVGCDSVPRGLGDSAVDEAATQSIDGKMTSIDAKRRIQQPRRGGLCPGIFNFTQIQSRIYNSYHFYKVIPIEKRE